MKFLSPSSSIGYTVASGHKRHGYNIYRVKVSHRCNHNIYNPCRKSHSDVDPIWLWWRVSLLPPRHPVCVAGIGCWILQYTIREYWMLYRGPGFLAVVWFWLLNPLPPSLPSVSSTADTEEDWERETICWLERGEGVEEEPNYTTARKPGPL